MDLATIVKLALPGSGCSTAAECIHWDREVVGSNLAGCTTQGFFYSLPVSISVFLNGPLKEVQPN